MTGDIARPVRPADRRHSTLLDSLRWGIAADLTGALRCRLMIGKGGADPNGVHGKS
jgi:hypothetical protein